MARTALETWTMEAVNAVLPEGTDEQKQRLAILMIQGRAKECRTIATELQFKNPTNQVAQAIALYLIDREHALERVGMKWAEKWPPEDGAVESEIQGERLVRLQ